MAYLVNGLENYERFCIGNIIGMAFTYVLFDIYRHWGAMCNIPSSGFACHGTHYSPKL